MKWRVAAVQLDCAGTRSRVEERAVRLVGEAAGKGAQVICLPEHWLPWEGADIEGSLPALRNAARDSGAYLLAGADFSRRDGKTTIDCVVIGPDGEEVGRQLKTHLFRRERERAEPGNGYRIFDLGGFKVGIAICHDLVYPEVARILTLKGSQVIFAPAKINAAGLEPWELYVKTRALENRVPVVSPNCLALPTFAGGSLIVGFTTKEKEGIVYSKVLAKAGRMERVIVADLDLASVERYRQERLDSRRPEIYSELL